MLLHKSLTPVHSKKSLGCILARVWLKVLCLCYPSTSQCVPCCSAALKKFGRRLKISHFFYSLAERRTKKNISRTNELIVDFRKKETKTHALSTSVEPRWSRRSVFRFMCTWEALLLIKTSRFCSQTLLSFYKGALVASHLTNML